MVTQRVVKVMQKDMNTGNVNVSGNNKAPAMKAEKASEGDDGANTKSVSS